MIIKNLVKIKELNILKAIYCYSLDFDGVNEYVNCTNNSAFDLDNTNSFSVYAWINVTSYDPSATEHIVSKYSNPPAKGYFLAVQANKIVFSLQNNGGTNGIIVETVNTFNTGQWYNVVITYDGSSSGSGVKIYVDSINEPTNVTADTLTGSILTSETLKIGGTVTPARYFNGKISSVRMWNTELSASEVLLEFYNSQSIVHPANLIVNTDINNSTFNGTEWDIPDLTGTTSGYQTVLMEVEDRVLDCPIPILPCNSLLFDGVAEYINCGNNTAFDLDGTDSYSISGWIKKTGATYFPILQKLFYPNTSTQDGYRIYIHPTLNIVIVNLYGASNSAISVHTTNPISINTWLNITVTYNGSETAAGVNIYVNGVSQALTVITDTYTGTMVNSEILTLGGQPTPTNPLYGTGNIASVRMWNVELTAGETLTEYNNGLSLASVQRSNLILNTDINNSIFNGSEWDIPDLTGITSGYQTVLMEVGDKILDCP
jgi:hypothetical protein